MSTERYMTRFPHYEAGRCRWCGGEVTPPRRTWCSQACVEEWWVRSSGSHVRKRVHERDRGVCAACGYDADAAYKLLRDAAWEDCRLGGGQWVMQRGSYCSHWLKEERWARQFPRFHALAEQMGIPMRRRDVVNTSLWEADHVVPVSEGGGCCGLEGFQTLCWRCHLEETRRLTQRRKAKRLGWTGDLLQALIDA